jgi:hypothetical protein
VPTISDKNGSWNESAASGRKKESQANSLEQANQLYPKQNVIISHFDNEP